MGIPIEPRLSIAALMKRQRLDALRKNPHAFDCPALGHTTPFGMYQQNLDDLISHNLRYPPQSARLVLVRKDLSAPVPITSNASLSTRLIPFMRRARVATLANPASASRYRSYLRYLVHPSRRSNSAQSVHNHHRAHTHRAASMRAANARESRPTSLLQLSTMTPTHTTARIPNYPLNPSRHATTSWEHIQARMVARNTPQAHHDDSAQNPSMHGVRQASGQSILLISSANSASRAQLLGAVQDPFASDIASNSIIVTPRSLSNGGDSNHNPIIQSQESAPDFQTSNAQPQRSSSTSGESTSRTSAVMSDKAISVLYQDDSGCSWELGCWVGIRHLGRAGIFGILVEVLVKTSQVPGSPVDALYIRHNLLSYSTVQGGVRLLKELCGQIHGDSDRGDDFFLHPTNAHRVQIVVSL